VSDDRIEDQRLFLVDPPVALGIDVRRVAIRPARPHERPDGLPDRVAHDGRGRDHARRRAPAILGPQMTTLAHIRNVHATRRRFTDSMSLHEHDAYRPGERVDPIGVFVALGRERRLARADLVHRRRHRQILIPQYHEGA
jgi:hypothetical protein